MSKGILAGGALVLALAVSATGCNKASDSAVLAKVNNTTITTAEFKKQVEELQPQMQHAVVTDAKARKEFLDDLVGIELVIQEAKRQGMDNADLQKKMDTRRKELERALDEEKRNELFNNVLKKEIGDQLAKVAPPTDAEVKDYFDKNKDKILAAVGKKVTLKEIEPQLKMRIMQEKRRDIYLAFAKSLRDKAKITVDDKALDAMAAAMAKPKDVDISNLKVQPAPAPKKEEPGK